MTSIDTATSERSTTHGTFVIERTYPVPVAEVWTALTDDAAREQWFGGGPEFDATERSHEFRVGGHTTEEGQWHGGPRSRFRATYTDIVDRNRMVFTYDMWIDGAHLSTSLTTITVAPDGDGTLLTFTEQGVFFDGIDTIETREGGTRGLLDNLGAFLTATR
ncbi:Uncharacterized conserved protein YndB, AHSA1/START domain [Nakamurella panacisegetis]|uniref:Uncharacterized conserved protein YndB, AHSA1/START domain n=1 Tax=Nakamurella panacisegetis TaxID=1090615 RepID=A0A1H0J345_9ACTN|nr:SRPBCC family protein [Nakamurella panacisegetis]SDO37943.1 Uncharacterized conserved protein YndB, AHSA1/START domain [Nakamurella panacisegetis]